MQDFFDCIYVINLASRTDRWAEIREQFQRIGLAPDHPKVLRFDAVRPEDSGPFPSIGARGCFMSHLGVLKHAQSAGFQRILILEDDLDFSGDFKSRWPHVQAGLSLVDWQIFYGTYEVHDNAAGPTSAAPLMAVSTQTQVGTTPFVAFQGDTISRAISFLEDMLRRPAGSPEGGPMHVDGAYNWLRAAHGEWKTYLASKQLGHQRPSRTDIHTLPWYDQLPWLRGLAQAARRLKRRLQESV